MTGRLGLAEQSNRRVIFEDFRVGSLGKSLFKNSDSLGSKEKSRMANQRVIILISLTFMGAPLLITAVEILEEQIAELSSATLAEHQRAILEAQNLFFKFQGWLRDLR